MIIPANGLRDPRVKSLQKMADAIIEGRAMFERAARGDSGGHGPTPATTTAEVEGIGMPRAKRTPAVTPEPEEDEDDATADRTKARRADINTSGVTIDDQVDPKR